MAEPISQYAQGTVPITGVEGTLGVKTTQKILERVLGDTETTLLRCAYQYAMQDRLAQGTTLEELRHSELYRKCVDCPSQGNSHWSRCTDYVTVEELILFKRMFSKTEVLSVRKSY